MQIGVGVAYYGGKSPAHAEACRALLRAGIPVMEIRGCAYREMALADVIGDALEAGIDVLVMIDPDIVMTPADVFKIAASADNLQTVVSASAGRPKPGRPARTGLGDYGPPARAIRVEPRAWDPRLMNGCAFTAVPKNVLLALRDAEERSYTNSARIGTGLAKNARPVFSPWKKSPGTIVVDPLVPGLYTDPDTAFLCRVQELGFRVFDHEGISVSSSAASSYSVRVTNAFGHGRERQRENGIDCNYAVCVASFGPLDLDQGSDLWELEKAGVTIVELNGVAHIDLARSELKRIAIDELGCAGVFYLDHDIMFRPVDLLSIVREAEERQDVVAAFYCMRKTAHALIGAPDIEVGGTVGFFELGSVVPAHYSGMGFTAIPKAVFEALDEFFPELEAGFSGKVRPYFALDANGNFYSGEDVSFCSRVNGLSVKHVPGNQADGVEWELSRVAGKAPTRHKVFLDSRVRIFHRGAYNYGVEDHSFAVPRLANLEAKHARTREEVRAALRTTDDLPLEVQARSIGADDGATHVHGGIEA